MTGGNGPGGGRPGGRGVLGALAVASTVGIDLAVPVTLGFFAGRYLDGVLHTAPWLMVAGILLGVAGGIWSVYKTISLFFHG